MMISMKEGMARQVGIIVREGSRREQNRTKQSRAELTKRRQRRTHRQISFVVILVPCL